jgi:hypothetical protein
VLLLKAVFMACPGAPAAWFGGVDERAFALGAPAMALLPVVTRRPDMSFFEYEVQVRTVVRRKRMVSLSVLCQIVAC